MPGFALVGLYVEKEARNTVARRSNDASPGGKTSQHSFAFKLVL